MTNEKATALQENKVLVHNQYHGQVGQDKDLGEHCLDIFDLTSFGSGRYEHLQKICFVKGDVG